jgi:UDP-glucuronate 4-epimerase
MSRFKIFKVYHLAAQAGVRYSLTNPEEYISNNINGFFNLIETCRQFEVKDFVFASTSGVYGSNSKLPFSEEQEAMEPENLYSATKRADELISISYSKNFNMKILSLRFFTVYGEYGRPDMGMYIFTDKIINDKPIPLFNNGQHSRSFTYIHDLIKIIIELHKSNSVVNLYEVLNIGNPSQHNLFEVVNIIANRLNKSFEVNHLDLQPGDLVDTQCDFTKTTKIIGKFNFTPLELGIFNFVDWFNKDGYKYAQK